MRCDRGYFCFPEVDLGLDMSAQFDAVLQTKYPRAALHQAWITGERYSAEAAHKLGFVDEVAPEAEVVSLAVARARTLVGKGGAAMAALKRRLHADALRALSLSATAA
jgi:enoyl-CoA hydratase/carnithine racemase